MTARVHKQFLRSAVMVACLAASQRGKAWDSNTEERVPSFPRHDLAGYNFDPSQVAARHFYMQFLKDAIGGSGGGQDDSLTKLFKCSPTFFLPPAAGGGDLGSCTLAEPADLENSEGKWLLPRRAGEVPHESEHSLLARAAALRSGLLSKTTLFKPFWLRYQAPNAWVGSHIGKDLEPDDVPAAYLVGQSLRPVGIHAQDFSFAARRVSLLELAQLPDHSNSLADWAFGNEACPIPNTEGAYHNVHPTEACHEFVNLMGAVNVTHFMPLAKEVWSHYHTLAQNKMSECEALAGHDAVFYDDWEFRWNEAQLLSAANSEAAECQKLAFTYEMFGLHFLQDAWASGHMMMRWGLPRFEDFPEDVSLYPGEVPPAFQPTTERARRAFVAVVVAGVAGMVHGAKSVTVGLARDTFEPWWADRVISTGLLDDPLNSGRYSFEEFQLRDVEWIDAFGERFPGAGDLFWDPEIVTGAVVSTQDKYREQRDRMLDCSAASMLQVYRAGPETLGAVEDLDVGEGVLEVFGAGGPQSDLCWGQWATNSAMFGALGAVNLAYVDSLHYAGLLNHINDFYIPKAAEKAINFPPSETKLEDVPEHDEELRARVHDRDRIIDRVKTRMAQDMDRIKMTYLMHRDNDPNGRQAARQEAPNGEGRLSVLGVPPVEPDEENVTQAVEYIDQLPNMSLKESDQGLSRMFWRGDLRRTCEDSLSNDAAVLHDLKSACIEAAGEGGDSEYCTACVALAELHIPLCGETSADPVADSKCSAAGVGTAGTAPPGLPEWWFNNGARVWATGNDLPEIYQNTSGLCLPSFYVALEWCTDTSKPFSSAADPDAIRTRQLTELAAAQTFDCNGSPRRYGTYTQRTVRPLVEASHDTEWLFPMIAAYDATVTTSPGTDPCYVPDTRYEYGVESIVQANVAPASSSEYLDLFYAGATVSRCGVSQRSFYVNRDCDEALSVFQAGSCDTTGVCWPSTEELGVFDEATGGLLKEFPQSGGLDFCYAREPRIFRMSCPEGLECTAGGECVPPRQHPPAVVSLSQFVPR